MIDGSNDQMWDLRSRVRQAAYPRGLDALDEADHAKALDLIFRSSRLVTIEEATRITERYEAACKEVRKVRIQALMEGL